MHNSETSKGAILDPSYLFLVSWPSASAEENDQEWLTHSAIKGVMENEQFEHQTEWGEFFTWMLLEWNLYFHLDYYNMISINIITWKQQIPWKQFYRVKHGQYYADPITWDFCMGITRREELLFTGLFSWQNVITMYRFPQLFKVMNLDLPRRVACFNIVLYTYWIFFFT